MSCVVGIKQKGKIYLGADSCVTDAGRVLTLKDPKIFRRGEFLIGFCGDLRVGQLLKHTKIRGIETIENFVEFMKELFKKEGYIRKYKDKDCPAISTETEFIIAHKGRMYTVGEDLSIVEDSKNDYAAIGSGADFALGSLFATKNTRISSRKRLIRALKCSAYFDPGVGTPFRVYSVKRKNKK